MCWRVASRECIGALLLHLCLAGVVLHVYVDGMLLLCRRSSDAVHKGWHAMCAARVFELHV